MIEWLYSQFLLAMQQDQVRAIVAGLAVGIAATESLAHMLPRDMEPYAADRLVRLIVFGVALCSAFSLAPTTRGFIWALFVGLSAPTLYSLGTRALYARWPALQPKALQSCSIN